MAALSIAGPPWILWLTSTRPGTGQSYGHLYLLAALVVCVLPTVICLVAAWFFARRSDGEDRCPSCGHQLLSDQRTCPECGGGRQLSTFRRISSGFLRQRSSHPTLFAFAIGFQASLAFASFVVLALVLVPTPRLVSNQRARGRSSGTVFSVTPGDGPDYPFTLTNEIKSRVTTAASFGGVVPYLPSDVALDVVVQGTIGTERNGESVGEAQPFSIAKMVRSRSDIEALAAELTCTSLGLPVTPSRDPLISEAGLFRMIASGYWPAPSAGGPTPTGTMAQADRWLALGEVSSPLFNLGIPSAVGVITFLVARPRRR